MYPHAWLARWIGFGLAGYSAVANDSIQTIGTFIASNRDRPWWHLWLYIGGIFLLTVGYSWWAYDGDVTFQRLASKGFEEAPTSFSYLQVAAPLFLMILTRLRMPVSTTFLLLSCFATTPEGVGAMLTKSVSGYLVAFVSALVVWAVVAKVMVKFETKRAKAHGAWNIAQWITSGLLWSVWVQQDAANIAVYLPRSLTLIQFGFFAGVIFLGLGILFRSGGERVQQVVDEKSSITDVRAATVVDFVYAIILYIFKVHSTVPMSTTWVFIGLLAGREIAMGLRGTSTHGLKGGLKLMSKDLLYVSIGLLVSIGLALAVNAEFRRGLFGD